MFKMFTLATLNIGGICSPIKFKLLGKWAQNKIKIRYNLQLLSTTQLNFNGLEYTVLYEKNICIYNFLRSSLFDNFCVVRIFNLSITSGRV